MKCNFCSDCDLSAHIVPYADILKAFQMALIFSTKKKKFSKFIIVKIRAFRLCGVAQVADNWRPFRVKGDERLEREKNPPTCYQCEIKYNAQRFFLLADL